MVSWLERHQILLYLAALACGAGVGLALPATAQPLESMINPVLGLLLYATFLAVPLNRIHEGLKDIKFLSILFLLNFVAVPIVVWCLTSLIAADHVLFIGVLFVLLAPCIDYVIVFSHVAGAASQRLLAATPLLMISQMIALPLFLRIFAGSEFPGSVNFAPFLEAFGLLIVLPLIAAGLTQYAAAHSAWGKKLESTVSSAMVPLMMATLSIIVASQISGVSHHIVKLVGLIPLYTAFAILMAVIGAGASRAVGLDFPAQRAVTFSGVTRNSMVILPLVLALPADYALAPLVVVTQTLVELVIMLFMIWAVPRVIKPSASAHASSQDS